MNTKIETTSISMKHNKSATHTIDKSNSILDNRFTKPDSNNISISTTQETETEFENLDTTSSGLNISDPTDEETERYLVVKPPSWWSSIIINDRELRVVTIGGSNTAGSGV